MTANNNQDMTETVKLGAGILFELRAQNVQLIDLRGVKNEADYFLIATCESEAQMQAILNEFTKEFKARKLHYVGVEYKEGVRWAIFDAGLDLMVHLFEEEKRNEISFERLYADGKITDLDEQDFVGNAVKKSGDDNELI